MSLVSLDDAKSQLQIAADYVDDDDELQDYADAIEAVVEEYLGKVMSEKEITEVIAFPAGSTFRLSSTPVVSLTSVATYDGATTWDVSKLYVTPSGKVTVLGGPVVSGMVRVVYQAGYDTPPMRYKMGALVILQHVWETQRGVSGVGTGVIGAEEMHARAGSTFTFPHKALEWLGPRPPVVA